jgi:hypothetical protein
MKVVCKKNYIENNRVLFKKHNSYDIDIITKEYVWVYLEKNEDIYKFYKEDYRPYLKYYDAIFFEDYFQTIKEERKNKLKILNDSNL